MQHAKHWAAYAKLGLLPLVGSIWKSRRSNFRVEVTAVKIPTPYALKHGEPVRVRIAKLPREPGIESTIALAEFDFVPVTLA